MARKTLEAVASGWRSGALFFLNTVVFLCAINVVAWSLNKLFEKAAPPGGGLLVVGRYGVDLLKPAYPGMSETEILQLHEETWGKSLMYEPHTEMREPPAHGRYVNVHQSGFRLVENQGPWPPDDGNFNVFVLGGSTTFGYGVADAQTIPSRLQARLRGGGRGTICVYNFGRSCYFSTQELILFEKMLVSGHRPQLVVFIDGLNEFYNVFNGSAYSGTLWRASEQYTALHQTGGAWRDYAAAWPVVKLGHRLVTHPSAPAPKAPVSEFDFRLTGSNREQAVALWDRYVVNQRLMRAAASQFGVPVLFVWQPVPLYDHDIRHHPYARFLQDDHSLLIEGYPHAETQRRALPTDFVWLADLQAGRQESLYVDAVHYNPRFSDMIAVEIAKAIQGRGLVK